MSNESETSQISTYIDLSIVECDIDTSEVKLTRSFLSGRIGNFSGVEELTLCMMCKGEFHIEETFVPSICLQKFSHRICSTCWWSKFALEDADHSCIECNKCGEELE